MRKSFCVCLIFFLLILFFTLSKTAGAAENTLQIQLNAKSAMLVEVNTGEVLFQQAPDLPIEPASFTKIITLYLVFEALQKGLVNLDDKVWVSEEAWRTGGSKMFLEVDSRVPLEELIKGIAVVSGNDACVAVAEHLHGSVGAFVKAMNQKAREVGMKDSMFVNPHGLPAEGEITTARDMATFAIAYIRRFPQALRYHSMVEYTYNNIKQPNRNRLLVKDKSIDGLKTGYVAAAGYHLAATGQQNGMRLLAVVMGAPSSAAREREAMKLLNHGFRHYALYEPFAQDKPVTEIRIWKGTKNTLAAYPAQATGILIPQMQKKEVRWEVDIPKDISAPIKENQILGKATFYVGNNPAKTVSLISREDVAKAGWFKRLWHGILQIHNVNWRWVGGIVGGIVVILGVIVLVFSSFRSRSRSKL